MEKEKKKSESLIEKIIYKNRFFTFKGNFSKSAFIAMTTWFVVMMKYIFSGLSFTFTKAAIEIAGKKLPAIEANYAVVFNVGEAVALLGLCFSLYFGQKLNITQDNIDERRDAK